MRPPTACIACRNRRRRCILKAPGEPCEYCKKRNVHCSLTLYIPPETTTYVDLAPEIFEAPTECKLPARAICYDLLILYFRYIADTTQWIFHKPSILEDFRLQRLPESLMFGIISITARFSNHSFFKNTDPRFRGLPYAQKAALSLDLRNVSVETIQLSLILGTFFSNQGEPLSEGVYYGISCRMATLLELDKLRPTDLVEAEVIVRLLWTLKMVDNWSSIANRVQRMLPPVVYRYPMDETTFRRLRRGAIDDFTGSERSGDAPSRSSMITNIIILNAIFERVADLITVSANSDAFALSGDTVDDLSAELDNWYRDLDPRLRDTEENLEYWALEEEAHILVSVYLGVYHFDTLLHYQSLYNAVRDNDERSIADAKRCQKNAAALCDLLYRAYDTPGSEVYYSMVGHVLVVASSVQIYTVMFSADESEIDAAKRRLERNYQILTDLLCFWPTLASSMTRLREFHSACLKINQSTFRMDKWMRRFLFEFAVPVQERLPETTDENACSWPLISPDLDFSPISGSDI